MEEFLETSYPSSVLGGSVRWAAPELYQFSDQGNEQPRVSKASDIYSYGSLVLEVRNLKSLKINDELKVRAASGVIWEDPLRLPTQRRPSSH